jgi:hypothetical protein
MSDTSSPRGTPAHRAPDLTPSHADDPRQLGLFSVATCGTCGCTPSKPCGDGETIGPGPICSFCQSKGPKR